MRMYRTIIWTFVFMPLTVGCADEPSPEDRLQAHIEVLANEGRPPVEFVLELLQEHDLILFDDANHSALEPFEFYRELVRTPGFQEKVEYIFLEAVSMSEQEGLDAYLSSEPEDVSLLYTAFQNDFSGEGWSYQSYYDLMHEVWEANRSLPEQYRLEVVAANAPVYWSAIESPKDIELFRAGLSSADYTQYRTILSRLERFADGHKGIYLTNTRHAYKDIRDVGGIPFLNAGTFFYLRHPGKTVSVRFHNVVLNVLRERPPTTDVRRTTAGMESFSYSWGRVADGLWDEAFAAHGNSPVALSLHGNVFGEAPYEGNHMHQAAPGQTMLDANDAVIFLAPLEDLHRSGKNGAMYTASFKPELARRLELLYTPEQLRLVIESAGVSAIEAYIDATYVSEPPTPLPQVRAAEPIDTWRSSGGAP